MNKRANRKAFFILLCIGLVYMSIAFDLTDRFSMKRTLRGHVERVNPQGLGVAVPEPVTETSGETVPILSAQSTVAEPSLFISVPLVVMAIKGGLIEQEGLVLIKGEHDGKSVFKKPLEILKDKDEEGLRSLAGIIGKKQLLRLLRKSGIDVSGEVDLNDMMLGKGYRLDGKALCALYDSRVSAGYDDLFPFIVKGNRIFRGTGGFEIGSVTINAKTGRPSTNRVVAGLPIEGDAKSAAALPVERQKTPAITGEWVMPDLTNLPLKAALEKVSLRTSRVKIHGSGFVTDQSPKPYEKIQGEAECVIHGGVSRK